MQRYQEPVDGRRVVSAYGNNREARQIRLIAHVSVFVFIMIFYAIERCRKRDEDISLLYEFIKDADRFFVGSTPLHLTDLISKNKMSAICCIDKSSLPPDGIAYMALLQNKHLFITHPPTDAMFSVNSLASLRSFSSLTPITGASLCPPSVCFSVV